MRPALDPYSAKNRQLRVPEVVEILGRSGLMIPTWRLLKPPFSHPAERLQADGTFGPATEPEDLGILYRPIVMEVSRWDRLKGWAPLVEGFATLKRSIPSVTDVDHRKVLEDVALLLVGPEPAAVLMLVSRSFSSDARGVPARRRARLGRCPFARSNGVPAGDR